MAHHNAACDFSLCHSMQLRTCDDPSAAHSDIIPLHSMHSPVINPLRSQLARNTMRLATSSGDPNLPKGIFDTMTFSTYSGTTCVIGVSTNPGTTALTRILREATSLASARVKPRTPPFYIVVEKFHTLL
jgi:hypothetical protein